MASFILIDPSCDIHLVTDPAFEDSANNPLNNLQLRLFEANRNTASPVCPPYIITPITIDSTTVGSTVFFDFFPTIQNVVTIDDNGLLSPQNTGDVLMQVRFIDGTNYHYNIVRIRVHEKMNGWWFGNDSVSVYKDTTLAHTLVSIYALFDGQTNGTGGIFGDISGHGYVALSVPGPGPVKISISGTYRDRIQGHIAGATDIKGTLALPKHAFSSAPPAESTIPVHVVDFLGDHLDPNAAANPVNLITDLSRVDLNAGSRNGKFNMLFLAEGFLAGERAQFDQTVEEVSSKLFEDEIHAPFNLLKDNFNIWKAFSASNQNSITTRYDVGQGGAYVPQNMRSSSSNTNAYTLHQLIRLVGLPTHADAAKSNPTLRNEWNTAGSAPKLQGFDPGNAENNIIDRWKAQIPIGLPQARDSFYGFSMGKRWGERASQMKSTGNMIAPPVAGSPTHQTDLEAFAQRVYEWYEIDSSIFRIFTPDPRRYAPEMGTYWGPLDMVMNRVGRLADSRVNSTNSNHWVGRSWHPNYEINPAATTKEVKSLGLICVIINHEQYGGVRNAYFTMAGVSLKTMLTVNSESSMKNIRPLKMNPSISINIGEITKIISHEFGHSFNLGDEYEELEGVATTTAQTSDNLASIHEIHDGAAVVHNTATKPAPIDPDKVKWLKLHRTTVSDEIISAATVAGSNITIKLASGKVDRWRTLHQEAQGQGANVNVFLRNLKVFVNYNTASSSWNINSVGNQLPLDSVDLLQLVINDVPNDGTDTIELTGAPAGTKPFAAGSVIYVAKTEVVTEGNPAVPATLVEHKVMQFMRSNKLPLSNNQTDDNDFCNRVSKENDSPGDIPGFKGPCKSYKLIGIYEGGGRYTCEVYRPAGACKMRDKGTSFDHVCKYLIVNRVNAGRLADLEKYYPENKKG